MPKSIMWRLSAITIAAFLILFALNSATMLYAVRGNSTENMERLMQSNTREMAQEIEITLESTLSYLQTERRHILTLYENGELTGERILNMRYNNLLANKELIGSSILLNPGVITAETAREKEFMTADGYFVPYIYYSNDELIIEPVLEFKGSDWYEQPLQEQREILTDPYEYDTGSEVLQMVTLSLPIITESGEVLGGMYTDFPLNFVAAALEKYSGEGSSQRAMTASGYIMGTYNTNSEEIGQNLFELFPSKANLNNDIQNGDFVSLYTTDEGDEALTTFVPIQVGDITEKWFVESIVPKPYILATFNSLLLQAAIAAVVIALLIAAIVIFVVRKNLAPLKQLQYALTHAASGDLTQQINTDSLKDDEIGTVANAYNEMSSQMSHVVAEVVTASEQMNSSATHMQARMNEIAHVTNNVTNAIEEISRGAQEQSNNLEHANSKMIVLGQLIDEVSQLSGEMTEHIHVASTQATKGKQEVNQLRDHNELTNEVNIELKAQIDQLVGQIDRINNIMQTIQSIASQTNLLALNAAIEAARAGEAGKGFAVVADEVRALAEQSHKETEHVQETVQQILRASEQTQAVVQKSMGIMHAQTESVERTEQAFEQQLQFSHALNSEVTALIEKLRVMVNEKEKVLFDMESISAISEQSSATAQEVVASAEEQRNEIETIKQMMNDLNTLADDLKTKTSLFKLN